MGLCNSPDIFQEKINELLNGLDYVRTFIDDLLIISNKSFGVHIHKVDKNLSKLKQKGFKKMQKSPFSSEMNWNTYNLG